jgi:hypothetical protein
VPDVQRALERAQGWRDPLSALVKDINSALDVLGHHEA